MTSPVEARAESAQANRLNAQMAVAVLLASLLAVAFLGGYVLGDSAGEVCGEQK